MSGLDGENSTVGAGGAEPYGAELAEADAHHGDSHETHEPHGSHGHGHAKKPVEAAEYVDTAVGSRKTYTYRVTAVDQAGNESAPGNEVRAAVP